MIEIQLQPQCYNCKDVVIDVDTNRLYSGPEIIETICEIKCTHATVCKKISETTKERDAY